MNIDRALEIVGAINDRAFAAMGLKDVEALRPLGGVSLREMLAALDLVEADNESRREEACANGGGYSMNVVPAERLVAAVYTLENFEPDGEVLAASPSRSFFKERYRILAIGTVTSLSGDDELEDERP